MMKPRLPRPAMSPSKSPPAGHAAHTRDAATNALPGEFLRPIKITMLGAGSGFTPRLLNDVLRTPGQQGGTIALVDIDRSRLRTMTQVIKRLVAERGQAERWKVIASEDRTKVMGGSHYLVNCIEVSGLACVQHDNDIPLKYGVDQCIGDTIGPGGLFKALRTIPVWLEVLKDAERLCPEAWVLNYTNPMAMMCTAAARTSTMKVVGLCHSVQGTSHLLAQYAGVPFHEMEWACAGINHLAWFTTLRHHGKDLYPALYAQFEKEVALGLVEAEAGLAEWDSTDVRIHKDHVIRTKTHDLIRKDMCLAFGAFITESSGHLSEYLPYYRKSEAGRKLLRLGYEGGSRFYATNWPTWRAGADSERKAMVKGEMSMDWSRSWEYASWIIEAREKDAAFCIHGNVMNTADGAGPLISNLPSNACVEVSCLVDGQGVQPTRHGALPPAMAAISASNLAMFDLGAQAAIERRKDLARQALLLDPLTAAICTPREIQAMTLEMFAAEAEYLPDYR